MNRYSFLILCVLFVFGGWNKVSAKIPPCSGPAAISGPDTVCEGAIIALSDTTTGGNWSSSNVAVAIIGSTTGNVTGISGGTAVITYTLPSGCFVTMPLFVKPILPINGSDQICAGATGTFSDLSTGGTWNSSSTTVASIDPVTGSATAHAAGITMITYTAPNGCSTRTLVTVNPLPLNYYVLGGGYYCAGTSGATIGLNGSDSGINYLLYFGTTLIDSVAGTGSAVFFGPDTGAGTYQIYGVNIATRCSNRMSGIAVIGVIPDNVPSVSITTGVGDTVCILANTTFTALPVNAGASPIYEWFVNGGSVGTGVTYSYIPNNGDVVSVIITSDAVCAIPSTATSSMTMTTIPKVMPSLSISVVPVDTVCAGTTVTIIPAPVNGGTAPTYRWIKNGITATTGPVYNFLPANGDNILCSIHSNYECLITDSAYSINNINMTVVPLVTPSVTIAAHPGDTIEAGASDTLVAIVTHGGSPLTYEWKINGITIPGATTDPFISDTLGNKDTVCCKVTSLAFCSTGPVSNCVVITDTSRPLEALQIDRRGHISLAPNPNNGVFTISGLFTTDSKEAVLEVTDVLGQLVYRHSMPLQNGKLQTQVDLGDQLPNGVYIIRISANKTNLFHKLVINR